MRILLNLTWLVLRQTSEYGAMWSPKLLLGSKQKLKFISAVSLPTIHLYILTVSSDVLKWWIGLGWFVWAPWQSQSQICSNPSKPVGFSITPELGGSLSSTHLLVGLYIVWVMFWHISIITLKPVPIAAITTPNCHLGWPGLQSQNQYCLLRMLNSCHLDIPC